MSSCPGCARFGAVFLKIAWALLLVGCGVLGAGAWGQTSVDGAIGGFVVDASGAALAGASVRARNVSTGLESGAETGRGGEFLVARLPAGEYLVEVDSAGFERLTLRGIAVELGGATTVLARMQVAEGATSMTVTAGQDRATEVGGEESSSAAVASTITAGEIERLPVNGRRWQTFALLTPTVHSDPEGDGLLSFRGLASTQNSSRIDGGDDDQSFGGVPRGTGSENEPEETGRGGTGRGAMGSGYGRHAGAAYTFSQEAVREFRVSGQNYSALYGHAAGGVVTTVSKRPLSKGIASPTPPAIVASIPRSCAAARLMASSSGDGSRPVKLETRLQS